MTSIKRIKVYICSSDKELNLVGLRLLADLKVANKRSFVYGYTFKLLLENIINLISSKPANDFGVSIAKYHTIISFILDEITRYKYHNHNKYYCYASIYHRLQIIIEGRGSFFEKCLLISLFNTTKFYRKHLNKKLDDGTTLKSIVEYFNTRKYLYYSASYSYYKINQFVEILKKFK